MKKIIKISLVAVQAVSISATIAFTIFYAYRINDNLFRPLIIGSILLFLIANLIYRNLK